MGGNTQNQFVSRRILRRGKQGRGSTLHIRYWQSSASPGTPAVNEVHGAVLVHRDCGQRCTAVRIKTMTKTIHSIGITSTLIAPR
jgi:hypothetical protein